ncbi:UNVERIFIED_CONTAM: hypothetical protein BEN50_00160 [Euhalothece sp. KZN 001]
MNQNFPKIAQLNLSGIGCWLTLIVGGLLLTFIGLDWVVNGVLIVLGLIIIIPAIALFGVQWWLKRNLVEDECPVCQYQFTGFNGTMSRCPNCSEPLKIEKGKFQRITPPGTIDVEAVDVDASSQ